MENSYYTVKDIELITGLNEVTAYNIIKELNTEIKDKYKDYQIEPLVFNDKIEKNYFLKRMEIEL